MKRWLTPKLLLLAILLLQAWPVMSQTFRLDGKRKQQRVAFDHVRNLVIVKMYVNDKGPYNFILDTGVGPMIVTDSAIASMVDQHKLRPITIAGMGGNVVLNALACDHMKVRLGRAVASSIPAAILEDDAFGLSAYVGMKISGLLGYDFFSSFVVDVNYSARKLRFGSGKDTPQRRGEKIDIELIGNKPHTVVELMVPGRGKIAARVVLDNGASHALSLESLDNLPFPVPDQSIAANLGVGLGGPISGRIARMPEMRMGGFVFTGVLTSFPEYDRQAGLRFLETRHGNLGADILSRFNMVIDYAGNAMYLRPNSTYRKPFEHDMSGMELFADASGSRFFIGRIEPGSPAEEAELKPGDELITVNFNRSKSLNLSALNMLLRSGDGTILYFSVNRGGELLVKRIKLKKRI
ncbi:aspartyl protease family protein [Pedobacter deserti]|uniref:aspartyl protease family protein n=1 Tax=Pedobacter deserti TaxID=2817382 RepID=UPI00210E50D1|nr:aspartyl protease family protein [Pedobacter sp. SYSU D00382]